MPQIESGLYEQLINKLISNKLKSINAEKFYIKKSPIDAEEASRYLGLYLFDLTKIALSEVKDDDRIERQITIANKIIQVLIDELPKLNLSENLIQNEGLILDAVFSKENFPFSDFLTRIKQITPYTRLTQSELFTGNNASISLESEIRKEILSADEIYWLVSFIKYSGIRIFMKELEEFTQSGRKLKIITTTYMGATDSRAIEYLSGLRNTEIKVSYNSEHERLHAKSYLFLRNTGFHTGYIGSSNLSRSALTNGLEWNVKLTTKEVGHIIDKFKKTFDTYWEDEEFEEFNIEKDRQKLKRALRQQGPNNAPGQINFFDIDPFPYQKEILEILDTERQVHYRNKNLIVAATGTGKTIISSFDYKNFKQSNRRARLLFVAHRQEILKQAQATFQQVLRNANFGELWVDGIEPENYEYLFASVYTLNNRIDELILFEDYYDFIIIDEVHHIAADSYRKILKKFSPQILLGLTATPERGDGDDILKDFSGVIAAEIRLPEALNRKILCPFQYFALSDSIDLSKVSWRNGKYEINELTKIYTEEDRRVGEIISNCEKYLNDITDVRAIGFCVSREHAKYMAQKFTLANLKADYLTSENSNSRELLREKLRNKEINYLFVVDIFNEGVDIPEIDTVLFLRPTESLTIFLQQLGRGLRLHSEKDCLTVLDFVGNSRPEYDFEQKFRALIGKTHTSIVKEIEDEFPHLPLGCSIILEKKAREIILKNITNATNINKKFLITKIKNFKHQSSLPLTLKNFITVYNLDLNRIYKRDTWNNLRVEADEKSNFDEPNKKELSRFITKRLIQYNSLTLLLFLKRAIGSKFNLQQVSDEEQLMLLMLHFNVWQEPGYKLGFNTIQESIEQIKRNPESLKEVSDVIDILIDKITFIEKSIDLGFESPLKIHSRYNRDQILTAIKIFSFDKAPSNREGVALNKNLNIEALFVTLKKSEKEYSPTTLYDDYAISESLFHWQSQNATTPISTKGISYISHTELNKKILLFVREQNEDEYGLTMSYVFLGEADFVKSTGSRPMNIEWQLKEPMPPYIWKESAKLAVG